MNISTHDVYLLFPDYWLEVTPDGVDSPPHSQGFHTLDSPPHSQGFHIQEEVLSQGFDIEPDDYISSTQELNMIIESNADAIPATQAYSTGELC